MRTLQLNKYTKYTNNRFLYIGVCIAYLVGGDFGQLSLFEPVPILAQLLAIFAFVTSTILINRSISKTNIPLSGIISGLLVLVICGIASRLLLFVSPYYMPFSLLVTLVSAVLIYNIRNQAYTHTQNIVFKFNFSRLNRMHLMVLIYLLLCSLGFYFLVSARSGIHTDIWSTLSPHFLVIYVASTTMLLWILTKLNMNYRATFLLTFLHSIFTLSTLPIIFDPIFGGDTIWYTISYTKSLELYLPISKIYSLESLLNLEQAAVVSSFLQIFSRTSLDIISRMTGLDLTTVQAWRNAVLAAVVFPTIAILLSSSLLKNRNYVGVTGLSFLLSPGMFIWGLSVGWSMGMGMIFFALVFSFMLFWVETRSRRFLVIALIFLAGTFLAHPISGVFGIITVVIALGFRFIWSINGPFRYIFWALVVSMIILYPVLPPLYYDSSFALALDPDERTAATLQIFSIREGMTITQILTALIYPLIACLGLLISYLRPQKTPIVRFAAVVALIIASSYLFNRLMIPNPPITPGREIHHLYVVLFLFVIIGMASIYTKLLKTLTKFILPIEVSFIISILFFASFVNAFPVDTNKNGQLIPLEVAAAKELDDLDRGNFAVITDFNNNWAGNSIYGFHNPSAYYHAPVDYVKINFYYNMAISSPRNATTQFLIEYESKAIASNHEDLDSIYLILSSYRFYNSFRYAEIITTMTHFSNPILKLTDNSSNEVVVFKIYDRNAGLNMPQSEQAK